MAICRYDQKFSWDQIKSLCQGQENSHKEGIQLQLVQILPDGGSRHVQRYVRRNGLVRKNAYETRQGSGENDCRSYVVRKD